MTRSSASPLRVAWISDFPIEWMQDLPPTVARPPREHPRSWQQVLLPEMENDSSIDLHVIVARKQWKKSQVLRLGRTTFHLVKMPPFVRAPSLFWVDSFVLRRVLRRIRPDVVHAWGTEKGAALVASRLCFPYVVTVQGLLTWLRQCFPLPAYERFGAYLERTALLRAPLVTAESRFAVEYVRRNFNPSTLRHVDVVPHRLFHQIKRTPELKPVRLLYIAELGIRKGGDVMLRALERLRGTIPFNVTVIGTTTPQFRQSMGDTVSREVWDAITFRPNLTSAEIAQELATTTLMICPTRADTGPMVVKEAVVAGVPVIGSDVGGLPDYVVDGRNGYLVPTGDFDALARAIKAAMDHPLFSKGFVDEETLADKRRYLSPEAMAQKFSEIYRLAHDARN